MKCSWTVNFCVPASEKFSSKELDKWHKEIYRSIRPLVDSCTTLGDCIIDLDSPKLPELVLCLDELHKSKVAWLNCPEFVQHLSDDEDSQIEWFLLDPKDTGECYSGIRFDPPTCKADRFKPETHVAGLNTDFAVSEQFRAVVEDHKLTGLEFLWVKDIGKYRAPQWFFPIASEPLGRGLDHPWFDSTKMSGQGMEPIDPRSRSGQSIVTSLGGYRLKSKAAFGDPVKDKFLSLAKSMSKRRMVIVSRPIYLREYIPATDFGYTLGDYQNGDDITRLRGLAVNRRTKDLLVERGLLTESECGGVLILDKPYDGAEVLDRIYGKPVPLFSPKELRELRAKEAVARAEFLAEPKPIRAPSMSRALTLLRLRKRNRPKDFAQPATAKEISKTSEALGCPVPGAWEQVLRVSNGGKIKNCELAGGFSCTIIEIGKLVKERRLEVDYYRQIAVELPETLQLFMQTKLGDSIWLDTTRLQPDGDCRVVLMSHETGEEEREWSSVAAFLDELLT